MKWFRLRIGRHELAMNGVFLCLKADGNMGGKIKDVVFMWLCLEVVIGQNRQW